MNTLNETNNNRNPLVDSMYKARNGHYCHCLELSSVYELESIIESFISEYQNDIDNNIYSEADFITFFETMEIIYYPEDGIENKEHEEALYNFSAREYIQGTIN